MSRKMQGVELSLPVELSFLVLVGFPSGHLHLPSSVIPVLSLSSRSFTVIPVLSLSSPRKRGSMAPHPLSKRARQAVPLRDIRDLAGGVSGQWLSSRAPILPPLRHPRGSGDPWSAPHFLDSRFRGNDGLGVGNDGLGVGNDGLGVGNDGLGGWE